MKNIREIVNPSDLDLLQNAISEKQLVEKAEMPFLTFIEVISLFIFTYIYNCLSLGQYEKQPFCTWDARSERSAQRRGRTVQPTLDVCMYTCIHVHLSILTNLSSKTLGESGRGGSFACFWEWGAKLWISLPEDHSTTSFASCTMPYALCTMHTGLCRWDMRWLIKRTPPWSQSFQLHSGWPLSSESSIFELLFNYVF